MFVDRAEIEIEAGRGGNGCVAFRREKYVPQGGPNGGDGGDGGNIIFRAREGVNSLVQFAHRKHWRAENGHPGQGSDRHGRNGEDLLIDVPPGTVILDSQSGMIIRDLVADGEDVIVARGGRGGKGNAHFKSSINQAPREASKGSVGESRKVILELKVIADVGLVGKPNAGKSTLLSRLSRARPEIADYPFTTKYPNLGLVSASMERSFVMADIPGLIEGAADGAGLGHDFLRHIMRAGILVHLVEPLPSDQTDPIENYTAIQLELEKYSPELAKRPEIVVVSKSEIPESEEVFEKLKPLVNTPVLRISAVTGQGLNELIFRIVDLLDQQMVGGEKKK
ncbi:MAG: GTPase ObgE [Pirellulales bacterium]